MSRSYRTALLAGRLAASTSTRPAAAAHRHHHGRQRPLGAAARAAAHRGPRRGVDSVRATIEECCRLGIGQLTLYCLSTENWKRPQTELDFLMALLQQYLIEERAEIMEQNIRFTVIGRRERLARRGAARDRREHPLERDNTGMTLCLAINYGRRTEIVDAVRSTGRAGQARRAESRRHRRDDRRCALYTAGMPDPDLLIRTAGEMRVSNFLLWQISYAELWVTPKCWPDFDTPTLHEALRDFAGASGASAGCSTPRLVTESECCGTRLIVGINSGGSRPAAMILVDERFAPWFPFLFGTVALLATLSTLELLAILAGSDAAKTDPDVNWHAGDLHDGLGADLHPGVREGPHALAGRRSPLGAGRIRRRDAGSICSRDGDATECPADRCRDWPSRCGSSLTSASCQLAWPMLRTSRASGSPDDLHRGTMAVALAVFVPKSCDIGAYFTGRFIGQHQMTPVLSPKKTWEGATGGLVMAAAVAVGIDQFGPVIIGGLGKEIAFGVVVGAAGMLGDLAESMIKRDCVTKDASQTIPGFGGVLDVVDAILFAAPVVYWLLQRWGDA